MYTDDSRGLEGPDRRTGPHRQTAKQFHFHRSLKDSPFDSSRPLSESVVTTIHLDDEADRWRFTCPIGHRTWEPTNGHFWCQSCADSHDPRAEPVFQRLHDLATDDDLERHEVKLVTDAGDYQDLRRSEA